MNLVLVSVLRFKREIDVDLIRSKFWINEWSGEKPKTKIMGMRVKIIGTNTYFKWVMIFGTSPNRKPILEQEKKMTHMDKQETTVKQELTWCMHFVMKKFVLKFG